MTFMMDEFEIVCWINFIDQVNLLNITYDVNDASKVLQNALKNIFFIGFSTKLLLNDKQKIKDPISAYMQR